MSVPLVLLPGMGCTEALWSHLDLPDAPLTPVLERPSLDDEVDRLLEVLPVRFALAGLSLGGIVAMAMVRRAPQRVSRLCLMSTNPRAPTSAQRAAWASAREMLSFRSARDLQAELLPSLLSSPVIEHRPDLVARTLAMADELGEAGFHRQLELQETRVDERPGLGRVDCPTLVLAARHDRLCPVDRHVEIAALVPAARLGVIEDSAHLSPLEQPDQVSQHLRDWLTTSP